MGWAIWGGVCDLNTNEEATDDDEETHQVVPLGACLAHHD
ncbi:hypothetical protein PAECIP111802_00168 [Paenibacillus allorhizosphaerae]|uniref:Uncharacterized protein n=1 Tax=Paenibacillus allorhizosphaerae TaxID=2849866 RepID=A0ABM8VAD2_9BACL|nr:hypothetical protein PAECIP111802_00168 [Paenibacillus allorhizosphaerae]